MCLLGNDRQSTRIIILFEKWKMSSMGKYKFLPRLLKFTHLEFDSAFQEILWALINPKRLFRSHKDRNAMRGYWARDDPAVLLIVLVYLAVSTFGYCLWLRFAVWRFFVAWLCVLVGDCLVSGAIVASIMWVVSNRLFLVAQLSRAKPVEWAYCFDIHLNAFIPFALLVYGLQMILLPVMASSNILSVLLTNSLWLMVLVYYIYITFLGYTVLPSMTNTTAILVLVLPLTLLYVVSIPFKWNAAIIFRTIFSSRCGVS